MSCDCSKCGSVRTGGRFKNRPLCTIFCIPFGTQALELDEEKKGIITQRRKNNLSIGFAMIVIVVGWIRRETTNKDELKLDKDNLTIIRFIPLITRTRSWIRNKK